MKNTLLFILIIFALAPARLAHASTTIDAPNASGLVGYWKLDDGSGTTARDYTGNGNTGTLSGSTLPTWISGKIGGGLNFNGAGYVNVPAATSLQLTTGTWSVWVKTTDSSHTMGVLSLASSNSGTGFVIYMQSGAASVYGMTGLSSGVISDGKWHFLTLAFNGSGSPAYMYVDGVQVSTATQGTITTGSFAFRIGQGIDGSWPVFYGTLDDVRIYNRALSASAVVALYNASKATYAAESSPTALSQGLVGYWPLDGSTINWKTGTISDISGQGNNGTPVSLGTTTAPTTGKIGQALNFNGSTSYVKTGAGVANLTTQGTVSVWIYSGNAFQYGGIAGKGNPIWGGGYGWYVWGSSAYFDISDSSYVEIATSIPSGAWIHLVGTFDGSYLRIYKNGVFVTQTAQTHNSLTSGPFYIGNTNNYFFNGKIDDVRIYNRALSAQEVAQLYALGNVNAAHSSTVTLSTGLVGYWTFDGGAMNWKTNTVADSSGQGNTGSLVSLGTTTSPTIGKIGQALKFNGSTSYVSFPTQTLTDNFTISYWDKTNSYTNSMPFGGASTANGYIWEYSGTQLQVSNDGETKYARLTYQSASDFGWKHVVVVVSAAKVNIYKNGIFQNSQQFASPFTMTVSRIGDAYSSSYSFNGTIDDVRVYNRALSAQEVAQLYLTGK